MVDGAVGGEAVDVVFSFWIPDAGALGACEDDGEGVVVVRCVLVLGFNCGGGGCGVVFGFNGGGGGRLESWGGRFESAATVVGASVCVRCHDCCITSSCIFN